MNRYFNDVRYHLHSALTAAKAGIADASSPLVARSLRLLGREPEPEPTRTERWRVAIGQIPRRIEMWLSAVRGRRTE